MRKYWFCEKPAILTGAEKAQRKFHPFVLVVLYLLFTSVLMHYLNLSAVIAFPPSGDSPDYVVKLFVLACLFYLVPLSLFLFFVRFVEKRSWASMGFVRNKVLKIYLILTGVAIVAAFLITYQMDKTILGMPTGAPLYAALMTVTAWIYGLCYAVVLYGFLMVSLTNRMSMKNAILVVVLVIPLVNYITEMGHIITSSIAMHPPDTGFWKVINIQSSLLIKTTLSTVASIIIMASCALLLLRTSHIWGVAILVLCANFITNSVVGLPTPYDTLVVIAVAAAILCAVLFWPKKTLEKQEGAGFVSQ